MAPEDRFKRIVQDGLCIGCGLCQSVAGPDKIRVIKAAGGELRPAIVGALTDADVDRIYATCPGVRIEGLPPEAVAEAQLVDAVWGPLQRVVLGWAAEAAVRHEGSTGGVLTALAQYLLSSRRVDFILHVKAHQSEPSFGQATLSFTTTQVLEGAGSRYGPTAPLIDIEAALALGRPLAIVAKPCDLNALRNLAHLDARVNRLIRYWLTPVCGGYMPDAALSDVLRKNKIDRAAVNSLRYRGLGCPGPTTIGLGDGGKRSLHYLDFWGEDESAWSLPFRCKICPDGIGEGADIAAADIWPNATPDRAASLTDPGVNSILIRTRTGLDLINAAVDDGAITLGREVGVDFLGETQPHQVKKKRFALARHQGLRDAGRLAPKTVGLRLPQLAAANSEKENERERKGAASRAMKGLSDGEE